MSGMGGGYGPFNVPGFRGAQGGRHDQLGAHGAEGKELAGPRSTRGGGAHGAEGTTGSKSPSSAARGTDSRTAGPTRRLNVASLCGAWYRRHVWLDLSGIRSAGHLVCCLTILCLNLQSICELQVRFYCFI